MALQDLGILQDLPLRVKAIFVFVQKTTANVKASCLLMHSLHTCKEHDRDCYILLAIEDCKLDICREFSWLHECFEFMKEDRTGKLTTSTDIYSRNHLYIKDSGSLKRVQEFWF